MSGARRPADRPVRAVEVRCLGAALLLVVAAPTVGDIGSCGAPAEDLDPVKFFQAKAEIECERCVACGLDTATCAAACRGTGLPASFEVGCYPLVHDGEVCLNALEASGCGSFESFVRDDGATVPTECNFCPLEEKGR